MSAIADNLFESVWPFCGVGASRVKKKASGNNQQKNYSEQYNIRPTDVTQDKLLPGLFEIKPKNDVSWLTETEQKIKSVKTKKKSYFCSTIKNN